MKFFEITYDENTMHKVYNILGIKISQKDKMGILRAEKEYLRNAINKIGADKMPPATGELRQWQLELLELLKTFDKICRENSVQYWLDFGTLLGAIRHKGFIPWDDDVDTSMLISDLDKILPILEEYFKNTDFIIRKRAQTCNNFQIRIRHKQYNLGIDIFPVYKYPENNLTEEIRNEITEKIIKARKIFEKKYNYKNMPEALKEKAINDITTIQNSMIIPQNKCIPDKPILFHGIEFPYEEGYYVMPNDEIFPLKETYFENLKLYIPNKYEQYLSNLWKNWNEIPSSICIFEHYYKNYKNNYEEE